jgi:hypothetical protein
MGFQKGNLLLPYLHSSNFVGICVYEYEHDCVEFLSFFYPCEVSLFMYEFSSIAGTTQRICVDWRLLSTRISLFKRVKRCTIGAGQ